MNNNNFVILNEIMPNAIYDIRYYQTNNFIGKQIPGYEQNYAILTKEAAIALKKVNDELLKNNLCLKIFDAYRPQIAVDFFLEWTKNEDNHMKNIYYPNTNKKDLPALGYISKQSSHSRGSTIDLTIYDNNNHKELDMGSSFDYFGPISHSDYQAISKEQYKNRIYLQTIMKKYGFVPIKEEWWHFTLKEEPFPNTYFNFPIKK